MGILRRKVIDYVRQRNRSSQAEELDTADPLDAFFDRRGSWRKSVRGILLQPLDSIDREEFWPIFQQCLDSIPSGQANAFVLREMEEMESATICKELEISSSNLWVLLHRARLRLGNCIKQRWLQEKE